MAHTIRNGALAGIIAAASMAAVPAQAAEIQAPSAAPMTASPAVLAASSPFDPFASESNAENAEYRRRWRGYRRYRRGRRVRTGDVLAGVLVLGGIAAIASAANRDRRRDRDVVVVRDRDNPRYDDRRYDDRRDDRRSDRRTSGGSGIDNAVSICLNEIERDVRVDSVDNASRLPEGWLVSGTLFNGSGFNCQIGNDGRIADIDYGSFSSFGSVDGQGLQAAEGQWSDDSYADARASVRGEPYAAPSEASAEIASDEPRPAYPGGPLPGETFSD